MVKVLLLFSCLVIFGCKENTARKPLNKKKEAFYDQSIERNKAQLVLEQENIQKAITEDTLEFQASPFGFWYAYINQETSTTPLPSKGDLVEFTYTVEALDKTLLYNEKELGTVRYSIDEEELLPALRKGLKLMRPKEVVVFLFPSYLCYSYQGDGEKIGINQPLRYTIQLKTLTKK